MGKVVNIKEMQLKEYSTQMAIVYIACIMLYGCSSVMLDLIDGYSLLLAMSTAVIVAAVNTIITEVRLYRTGLYHGRECSTSVLVTSSITLALAGVHFWMLNLEAAGCGTCRKIYPALIITTDLALCAMMLALEIQIDKCKEDLKACNFTEAKEAVENLNKEESSTEGQTEYEKQLERDAEDALNSGIHLTFGDGTEHVRKEKFKPSLVWDGESSSTGDLLNGIMENASRLLDKIDGAKADSDVEVADTEEEEDSSTYPSWESNPKHGALRSSLYAREYETIRAAVDKDLAVNVKYGEEALMFDITDVILMEVMHRKVFDWGTKEAFILGSGRDIKRGICRWVYKHSINMVNTDMLNETEKDYLQSISSGSESDEETYPGFEIILDAVR